MTDGIHDERYTEMLEQFHQQDIDPRDTPLPGFFLDNGYAGLTLVPCPVCYRWHSHGVFAPGVVGFTRSKGPHCTGRPGNFRYSVVPPSTDEQMLWDTYGTASRLLLRERAEHATVNIVAGGRINLDSHKSMRQLKPPHRGVLYSDTVEGYWVSCPGNCGELHRVSKPEKPCFSSFQLVACSEYRHPLLVELVIARREELLLFDHFGLHSEVLTRPVHPRERRPRRDWVLPWKHFEESES